MDAYQKYTDLEQEVTLAQGDLNNFAHIFKSKNTYDKQVLISDHYGFTEDKNKWQDDQESDLTKYGFKKS